MQTEQLQNKRGRHLSSWLGLLISGLCIVALFFFIDPAEIMAALRATRYEYVLGGCLAMVVYLALRAIRWRFLLKGDVAWGTVFHVQNIGYMLTMLLPLRLGDVARAVLIGGSPSVSVMRGASTMIVERLMDLLFIVVLLPFTIVGMPHLPDIVRVGALVAGVLAVCGTLVLIVVANQRPFVRRIAQAILGRMPRLDPAVWLGRLDNLLEGLDSLTRWRDTLTLMLWSVIVWLPIIFSYYVIMLSVDLPTTLNLAAFTVCIAGLGVAAPSSPGQIGVFEASVTLAIITAVGAAAGPAAASFAIVHHAVQFATVILLGLIGLMNTGETFGNVVRLTRRSRA